jgi:hypothetical protein
MPAGKPRSTAVAAAAKSASKAVKKLGLRRLRSRVKRSVAVRSALYRPYGDDRPVLDPATAARLREQFEPEVHRLDDLLGRQVSKQWGYGLRDVTG